MRYLLLGSCLFLLFGCTAVYKDLQPASGDITAIKKFSPNFDVALYKAQTDIVGHHLSGLLLIKKLQDSSIRIVFSNEVGFKFFDFEYRADGGFKVYYIIKQMDNGPVIKTLKKDFELLLIDKQDIKAAHLSKDDNNLYYIFKKQKGFFCYVTNKNGAELERMEISSPHKPIVLAIMKNYKNGVPDTIGITHKNFNFTIELKRIERQVDATE
ncbi:hypothetical protein ACFGVR_21305 [Mucilaginibacter sp. AW1-3]